MNALCHRDHRVAGPILVKQYRDRIEMTNAGGLIGNTTPDSTSTGRRRPATRASSGRCCGCALSTAASWGCIASSPTC